MPLSDLKRLFTDLLEEPLAVEAILAALVLFVLYLLYRALRGIASRISRRRALREFVTGLDAYFKGEYELARTELGKVLARDPENSEARILLGDACRALGDLAEAHKHHYHVAKVFERDLPRNESSLGRDLLTMGRAEESGRHLSRALEDDPDNAELLELLITAHLGAGRYREAADLAKRLEGAARGEGRNGGRARRLRATVCAQAGRELLRRGETKEGRDFLLMSLSLNPSLVTPRLELVRNAWMGGSARDAEKELRKHLDGMKRLAEAGEAIFEPPAPEPAAGAASGRRTLPRPDGPESPVALPGPGSEGESAAARALPPPARAALPAPAAAPGDRSPVLASDRSAPPADEMPAAPLDLDAAGFVDFFLPYEAAYLCGFCGRPEREWRETCPECGRFGTLATADPSPLTEVAAMREIFDEVQENRAYLRTLVARAARGDGPAADRLVAAGPRAVSVIFKEMFRVEDEGPLVTVLARLGPAAVDAIFEGWRRASRLSAKRIVRAGMRAFLPLHHILVRSLTRMGDDVVPFLTPLLDTGDRETRIVVLDVLIRLGRADLLEELRFVVPPKEILERLNACSPEELCPFLGACTDDGFLATQVLRDRTFTVERALVAALLRDDARTRMRAVLLDRGFSSDAYEALEGLWEDPSLRLIVTDIVRSYGRAASDHLLKTCTSIALPEVVREDALRLLVDLGADEVERLVEHLAEGDPEMEKAVLRIVNAFGNRAVPTLVRAYGKTGLLGKVGLNKRRITYRKLSLLRALEQIGTYEAIQGLRQIQTKEGDPDLARRIRGILERLSGAGGRSGGGRGGGG